MSGVDTREKKNMKKSMVVIVLGVLLLSCVCLFAADEKKAAEPYDEDTYGPEALIIWDKPVKGVVFDHKIHTQKNELACDSCHDELFSQEAGAVQEKKDFTMATLEAGGYCGSCHDGETAFASNKRCTSCHIGVRGVARLAGGKAKAAEGHEKE